MSRIRAIITLCAVTMITGFLSNKATAADGWQSLFDGKTLNGWHQINGSAPYTVENGAIVGTAVLKSKNSFLATKKVYIDFIMEFETKVDGDLNSGVQFRSLSKASYQNGRVHGYQLEIDPSERKWTGGIYDEGRSLWLYSLSKNESGRNAYQKGEWNNFRIEAIGNSLRTYVNGIPTANLLDNQTMTGFFALQVHGIGKNKAKEGLQVRWRNLRIKTDDLASEAWSKGATIAERNYIPNKLSKRQKAEGWQLLWDGETTNGWRSAKHKGFPKNGWQIEQGVLSVLSSGGAEIGTGKKGGDIITEQEFSNFELEVDFNISKGANSGIKYFVDPTLLKAKDLAIGLEFQILDDKNHPDAKKGTAGNRTVGSLYDLITAANLTEPARDKKRFNGIGKWNRARIVVNGGKVEHWLNGVQTVEFDRHSQMFRALVAYSKYAKWPNFGEWQKGPILLQDHGDLVHFRTIKIKNLDKAKEQ